MKFYYGSEISYVNAIPLQIKRASGYILITNNLSVAILESIKLKHIPLFMISISKQRCEYFFIVETTKNACDLFKHKSYIYELDCNESDVKKNDWLYSFENAIRIFKTLEL
jgi:putative lipase involved disintegration of autophagic bodies